MPSTRPKLTPPSDRPPSAFPLLLDRDYVLDVATANASKTIRLFRGSTPSSEWFTTQRTSDDKRPGDGNLIDVVTGLHPARAAEGWRVTGARPVPAPEPSKLRGYQPNEPPSSAGMQSRCAPRLKVPTT